MNKEIKCIHIDTDGTLIIICENEVITIHNVWDILGYLDEKYSENYDRSIDR